jgi:tetraacyldisaccharide 4'-kinase
VNQILQNAWRKRGWLACLFWPLALTYGLLVRLRWVLYRRGILGSEHFAVPVVVVGNVIAGGAGKTPLVIALVKHLQAQQVRVGVVSRGYGRVGTDCLEVVRGISPHLTGDEPALVKRATDAPVFVARRRADAVRALLAAYPATAVVVCDDGLQHYALQRDIEIAVFDDRGVENGWLLPAGPLREPWPTRERFDRSLVLHTGQNPAFGGFVSTRQLGNEAYSAQGEPVLLASLRGRPLAALAGIANPEAFFAMLRDTGLTLQTTTALADHHDFTDSDLQAEALKGRVVLCTEKDAVKLFALPGASQREVLAVPLVFSPEPAFFAAFDARLALLISPLPSGHGHQTA